MDFSTIIASLTEAIEKIGALLANADFMAGLAKLFALIDWVA